MSRNTAWGSGSASYRRGLRDGAGPWLSHLPRAVRHTPVHRRTREAVMLPAPSVRPVPRRGSALLLLLTVLFLALLGLLLAMVAAKTLPALDRQPLER